MLPGGYNARWKTWGGERRMGGIFISHNRSAVDRPEGFDPGARRMTRRVRAQRGKAI